MELLHSNKLTSGGEGGASTQRYVDVEEIRDDVIVLKDRSLRAVLSVGAINFDLKSTDEQDAIIGQYQNFLNSLDFPLQIVVSSRRLNIEPYLDFLEKQEVQNTNELLKFQLNEYRKFIKNLTEVSNIMSKNFYLSVPFFPIESKKGGILQGLFGSKENSVKNQELFDSYKSQLIQRAEQVVAGLNGIGLKIKMLKTEDLISLMYNSYNPNPDHTAIISDIEKVELKK